MADDPLGVTHLVFALGAVFFGTVVVLTRKGQRMHRTLGHMYFTSLLATNITALFLYDLTGEFNFFHASALLSLGVVILGMIPIFTRKPKADRRWLFRHAYFMSGSYVGVMAAFVAEIAVRAPGMDFGLAVGLATVLVSAVGIYLIATRVPRAIDRLIRGSTQRSGEQPIGEETPS